MKFKGIIATTCAIASTIAIPSVAKAVTLKLTIENIAPQQGALVTPVWFGFHDGSFNTFDPGATASTGIEHVAEDGYTGLENRLPGFENLGIDVNNFIIPLENTISGLFANSNEGTQDILSSEENPFFGLFPGQSNSTLINLNGNLAQNHFFSYAAMFFPSNDAFIADENPLEIFDSEGNFLGADFIISGNQVWDAGTEVNDESLANVPFTLPQIAQGVEENGTIQRHPGFRPRGTGGVLDSANGLFTNADFTAPDYQIARIKIEKVSVPEPGISAGLLVFGATFLAGYRLRRKAN
ncbi:hypothetical protein NIES593_01915 [Hydrococcus rivularis NIES-593]|uniref:PEP-CTERM sorting domain-containing protein n=1 Tax=Hydrococcus rivularis NIES-593 TaxID=1921803 RepID=A0A1U7HTA4_9CYAN|nr:spondin domain-containing protein [Hydrococcus rivularis]OKH26823.1 hypothetical protein NIES593_01915 [Hydrococcus rivularis NIES-593]